VVDSLGAKVLGRWKLRHKANQGKAGRHGVEPLRSWVSRAGFWTLQAEWDLRFVLADFPRLGSVCRIHTTSYRSIRQIHSALEEIQTFTAGRLAGLTAKLVVRPEETTYFDPKEKGKRSTTIWALSLEVAGEDMRKLVSNLTANARVFAESRKLLGYEQVLKVVEEEKEQAQEFATEFNDNEAPHAASVDKKEEISGTAPMGELQASRKSSG
jgi:Recombination directionality factor-like